ncbi:MAG: histidine kinase dimerization/phosphoacceptor domain -containing protein [Phycisphaerae bacterium]
MEAEIIEKIKILVVEDESIVGKDIQKTLQNLGYDVPCVVSSGEAAIQKAEENRPDLVLMDIILKGKMDGIEAAAQIRSRFNIPVVYLTAYTDDKMLERAKITEPFGYVVKPFEDRELKTAIEMALYKARMNEKIRQAAKQWETTFNSIGDLVSIHDKDYKLVKVNKAFANFFKIKPEELVSKTCYQVIHGTKEPHSSCPHKWALDSKKPTTAEFFEPHLGVYVQISASPIFNDKGEVTGSIHIMKDITDRKRTEDQIKKSLREKEVLLREIHHRVKNNMQVISSLLRLQSRVLEDARVVEIFKECQDRVRSMSLIHETFYRSKDLLNIDFAEYIRELADGLVRSFGIDATKIAIKIDVKGVSLGINLAIPCGLLVNELISNSLKHAFPAGRSGEIKISLRPTDENKIELIVSDNGVGVPEELDFRKTKSLGLQLVNTLVKDQLGGEIELDRSTGTKFKIKFRQNG